MQTIGLSFSDAGITACLYDGDDQAIIPLGKDSVNSPGYAYLGDRGLKLGEQAIPFFKLSPARSTDRFWEQLSLRTSSLSAGKKNISNAHLAYLHLKYIWERITGVTDNVAAVGLSVPGVVLSNNAEMEDRLGLMLGITSDLGIPVSVLLPMEVAGLHFETDKEVLKSPVFYHLNINQYQTHFYRLAGDEEVSSRLADQIPNCGFHHILEGLHAKLSQRFLHETAFDISEDSEVEQEFFLKVRKLLLNPSSLGPREISISYGGQPRKMVIAQDTMEAAIQEWTERISEMVARNLRGDSAFSPRQPVILNLSGRAANLPGLAGQLARFSPYPISINRAEPGAAAAGAAYIASRFQPARDLQHTPIFSNFKRPLPVSKIENSEDEDSYLPPTHILLDSIAYPLDSSGIYKDEPVNGTTYLPSNIREAFHFPWEGKDLQVMPDTGIDLSINDSPARGILALKTGDRLAIVQQGRKFQLDLIHCSTPSHA